MLRTFSIYLPGGAQLPGIESIIHSRKIIGYIEITDNEFDTVSLKTSNQGVSYIQGENKKSLRQRRLI